MAKRKKDDHLPDDDAEDSAFYKKLLEYRDDLARKCESRDNKANSEISGFGFWSVVAGAALVADWTLTGGVLTIIAASNGVEWMHHQNQANKTAKELKEVDEKILRLEAERLKRPPRQDISSELKEGLKDNFSRAHNDIDALRQQVEKLQKELDSVRNPKPVTFDKPKFGPPKK